MNYWVIKGSPRRNDWDSMLAPDKTGLWLTGRLARRLTKGDRVFFWESSPKLRIISIGTIENPSEGKNRRGQSLYRVRYLTRRLGSMPAISDLRKVSLLNKASFLKQGPATCIFPITNEQAGILFQLLAKRNSHLKSIWPDLNTDTTDSTSFDLPDLDLFATEGRSKLVLHLRRERSKTLVEEKKMHSLESTGALRCECCKFDFGEFYGELGSRFCEVHHRKPLSSTLRPTRTRLADLSIICSNCHRVIHRTDPMWTVSKLASYLEKRHKSNAVQKSSLSKRGISV
jgi:EVE domain/HNH endonuclease